MGATKNTVKCYHCGQEFKNRPKHITQVQSTISELYICHSCKNAKPEEKDDQQPQQKN